MLRGVFWLMDEKQKTSRNMRKLELSNGNT